jgi:hypothetical protein
MQSSQIRNLQNQELSLRQEHLPLPLGFRKFVVTLKALVQENRYE